MRSKPELLSAAALILKKKLAVRSNQDTKFENKSKLRSSNLQGPLSLLQLPIDPMGLNAGGIQMPHRGQLR